MEIEFRILGGDESLKVEIDRETEQSYWHLTDCRFEADMSRAAEHILDLSIRLKRFVLAELTFMDYRPSLQIDVKSLIQRASDHYFFQRKLENIAEKIVEYITDRFREDDRDIHFIAQFMADQREDIARILQENIRYADDK